MLDPHLRIRRPLLGLLLACSLAAVGCGGLQSDDDPESYGGRCKADQSRHMEAVHTKNYQPVNLRALEWPGRTPEGGAVSNQAPIMPEAVLVEALREGSPRTFLLTGGAGVGKSTLARSLRAQLCGEMTVVSVDLAWDLDVAATKPGNPIALAVCHQLGIPESPDPLAALATHLDGDPIVLLLDAFDETPRDQRNALAAHVRDIGDRMPNARLVVLARPPLFHESVKSFGGFQARADLTGADCTKVDWFVLVRRKAPWEKANYKAFMERMRLNKQITAGPRCDYAYIASYRDLEMLWYLAQPTGDKELEADFATRFKGARATLYEFYIKAQLLRGMEGSRYRPEVAMAAIDAMVTREGDAFMNGQLVFARGACEEAAAKVRTPGGEPVVPEALCKRLLATPVFVGKGDTWHFSTRTTGDFFVARALSRDIITDKGFKCDKLDGRRKVLEGSEVGSFLVGTQGGGMCVAEVTRQFCLGDTPAALVSGTIRRGLPSGTARSEALGHADGALDMNAKGAECAKRILDGLATP